MADRGAPPGPATGRVLGLDLGTVRIGLAVSDSRRTLASPYGVVRRAATMLEDHDRICEVVEECSIALIVVGLPLSLSGSDSSSSIAARDEVATLGARVNVPIVLVDERLTTVEAAARRRELSNAARGRGRSGRSRPGAPPKPAPVLDDRAAAIILQSFLDREQRTAGQLDPGQSEDD